MHNVIRNYFPWEDFMHCCLIITIGTLLLLFMSPAQSAEKQAALQSEQKSRDRSLTGKVVWAKDDIAAHTLLTKELVQAGLSHAKFIPPDAPRTVNEVIGCTTIVALTSGQIICRKYLTYSKNRSSKTN